jgi:hypothetical protein
MEFIWNFQVLAEMLRNAITVVISFQELTTMVKNARELFVQYVLVAVSIKYHQIAD